MKNLSRFFVLGALAAGMASCSNDIAPDGPGQQEVVTQSGYLNVNFQLPTQAGTRANDVFDDGLKEEYAFKNAAILIFTGDAANEGDAKFQYAYAILNPSSVDGEDNTNITTTYRKAIKVNEMTLTGSEHMLGLVMLNYDGVFNSTTITADGNNTLQIGKTTVTSGTTFSKILELTSELATAEDRAKAANPFIVDNGDKGKAFFMTNTVLCNKPGGTNNPSEGKLTVLADLGTELYPSANEALENPMGTAFVERGVAKVTVSNPTMKVKFEWKASDAAADAAASAPTATIEGFNLGNVDYNSYVVRNMSSTYLGYASSITGVSNDKYRFVGAKEMGKSPWQEYITYHRTYWAETPSYENGRDFHNSYTDFTKGIGEDKPLYCFENTFTVSHQDYYNTTRAVLKVKFSESDFYIVNDNDKVFYTKENAESRVVKYLTEMPALQTEIKEAIKANKEDVEFTETADYAKYMTITYEEDATTGVVKVASITPKDIDNKASFTCADNAIFSVNAEVMVEKYTGGIAYYPIVIKHFGDDLTPWEHASETNTPFGSIKDSYGEGETADKNYLGRYGLVRNNWYDINVSAIMKLGSPVDPAKGTVDNKPDDNNEVLKYIAFKVNTLKWAKRTHDYILK